MKVAFLLLLYMHGPDTANAQVCTLVPGTTYYSNGTLVGAQCVNNRIFYSGF
jgi:hypothetical protein